MCSGGHFSNFLVALFSMQGVLYAINYYRSKYDSFLKKLPEKNTKLSQVNQVLSQKLSHYNLFSTYIFLQRNPK